MGTSTQVGHYVCHILHEGHWVIFNDNKVAFSENPPKDLGYLYLYERLWLPNQLSMCELTIIKKNLSHSRGNKDFLFFKAFCIEKIVHEKK